MPAGLPVTNSSELMSSPGMVRLLAELKFRYRDHIILFDLPSVLSHDDATAFAPLVDCVLLVVQEGETRVYDVRQALNYLGTTKILGFVFNRSIHLENNGKMIVR